MNARTRMILTIVGALVIALAFFFFLIRPRQAELATVREDVAAEEARTQQLRAELARLEALRDQAPRLRAQLAELRELVPSADEIPNFIFLVQAASNAAGVDFLQITPEVPEPPLEGAPVAQIDVTLNAEGGYFSIQDFIRRLYALDRALRLDEFSIIATEDAETELFTLGLQGRVRIFFEPPAAPEPSPTAGGATPAPTGSPEGV